MTTGGLTTRTLTTRSLTIMGLTTRTLTNRGLTTRTLTTMGLTIRTLTSRALKIGTLTISGVGRGGTGGGRKKKIFPPFRPHWSLKIRGYLVPSPGSTTSVKGTCALKINQWDF